jgi:hypothetical protein
MVTLVKGDLSSNPDIIDIDADYKEPLLCSVYPPDIYIRNLYCAVSMLLIYIYIYSNFRVAEVCIVDAC